MHQTRVVHRLVSTGHGQRRILTRSPPVAKYIRQSVESGTYPPSSDDVPHPNAPYGSNFRNYPKEHEILTLFPPIPPPPRIPKKMRAARKSKSVLPTDLLVKQYLKRYAHDHETIPTEQEYYDLLLGIPPPQPTTAMGKKSVLLNKAYAFALKQYEILRSDSNISESQSIQMVEELLSKEKKEERVHSRVQADTVHEWRNKQANTKEEEEPRNTFAEMMMNDDEDDTVMEEDTTTDSSSDSSSSCPSILYNKPRAIEGMTLWSQRLKAVPYKEWTIGASTALDHWIARSILDMSEERWQELLQGSDDTSLISMGRDILLTRHSLFPETMEDRRDMILGADEETSSLQEDESRDKSIDELLASLGGFEDMKDDDGGDFWAAATDEDQDDFDATVATLTEELQEWRAKHCDRAYEEWTANEKDEFAVWLDKYVTTLSSKREGQVDMVATRKALLESPPLSKEDTDKFWNDVRDETEAEILLQSLRQQHQDTSNVDDSKAQQAFALFLRLPYEVQLQKLVDLGTLRPMLDEFTSESDRVKFLARYGETLMEGVEMEHLVPDPDGPILGEELGTWGEENGIPKDERFRLEMVPYGTDEFGTTLSDRAREMYEAWNTQKAGRARFEETMFKKGRIGFRYDLEKKK